VTSAPRPSGHLFRQLCQRCHGAGGEGVRKDDDGEVPDFRRKEWHRHRSDAEMLASILQGTGGAMPAFGGRVSETEARGLVAHVRAFSVTGPGERRPAANSAERASSGVESLLLQERNVDLERTRPPAHHQFTSGQDEGGTL
jgi:mono/diheme cytochrome c family protein